MINSFTEGIQKQLTAETSKTLIENEHRWN